MRQIPLVCLKHTNYMNMKLLLACLELFGGAKLSGLYFLLVPCTSTPKASKAQRFGSAEKTCKKFTI